MISTGFKTVPDWFSLENQGASVAVGDLNGNGTPDLVVMLVDSPPGKNRGVYRVGHDLDVDANITGGWTPWLDIPDWFSWENQGAGIALGDLNGNGKLDLVVMTVDNPPGQNRGIYRVGHDLDGDGNVTGGWTLWLDIPDWFSWENQGAGIALGDLDGDGKLDLVVMTVDNPPGQNRGIYRVGHDLDANGNVTGGWTPWLDMPDWFSWENQGGGVAVSDITGNGKLDLVLFGIDNPPAQNQAFFRTAFDVGTNGLPAGAQAQDPVAGWSTLLGVNNWFSWENEQSGIVVAQLGGVKHLLILAADHPTTGNVGVYTTVRLVEDPAIHGSWELESYNSQVLAIHAAVLHTGKVLFFAGSGNNTVRVADPHFGDVATGLYTSVVWDPAAAPPNNFDHPATIHRADGKPFDFFCGGDTFLADGRILSAGGNLSYNNGNNLGQRDVAIFDPASEQWSATAPMAHGRWYPQLLTLPDGRILTVSGKNETDGNLNPLFEVYDPVHGTWSQLHPPQAGNFVGLPFYAHLFLLADGRVFFSGGRMDDDRGQPAGILDLAQQPVGFQFVASIEDPAFRNQSSSVLLPPAQDQRVMIIGGGPVDDVTSATGGTEVVALNQLGPSYQLAMPLSLPRMHLNATLLPDRTVFVSGGAISHEAAGVRPIARLQTEIYDPETDTWRPGAAASVIRMYHSVALLLPDGRVVTTCGNPPPYGNRAAWEPPQPNEEMRIEIYSPPYLFAGARPAIGAVTPEWQYGSAIDVAADQPASVLWAELIRSGITTHAFDNSQRLVDLPIEARTGTGLTVRAPDGPNVAPPGWYMLFLVNENRVPSAGTWIHLS
ncbi:MAG: galactose oxidase-like domain-containing protein [Solirubrobacteraceae bacterium]